MYINHIRINSTANIKTIALQIYITQGKLLPKVYLLISSEFILVQN